MNFILLSLIVVAASYGQVSLKRAVLPPSEIGLSLIYSANFLIGVALYGFCSIAWLWVLKSQALSSAYPFLALTFLAVPIFAKIFLGESITTYTIFGAFLIVAGVILISRSQI